MIRGELVTIWLVMLAYEGLDDLLVLLAIINRQNSAAFRVFDSDNVASREVVIDFLWFLRVLVG